MPELPEVETIKKGLVRLVVGKKISGIKILKKKSFLGDPGKIIGQQILAVKRRAKLLIISLNQFFLLIHLKMTGQLIYKPKIPNPKSKAQNLPNKYTRVILEFDDKSRLFFNDLRIFGWIKVIQNSKFKIQNLNFGPEPFAKKFNFNYLKQVFHRTSRVIKLVLMDQQKIAGIGNIYANEALFGAGILPLKKANCLTDQEIIRLKKAVVAVLKKAIKYQGSTAADDMYRTVSGQRGKMQQHFQVYGREGQKCPRCGQKIKKMKLGGRGTFFCPQCQK